MEGSIRPLAVWIGWFILNFAPAPLLEKKTFERGVGASREQARSLLTISQVCGEGGVAGTLRPYGNMQRACRVYVATATATATAVF